MHARAQRGDVRPSPVAGDAKPRSIPGLWLLIFNAMSRRADRGISPICTAGSIVQPDMFMIIDG